MRRKGVSSQAKRVSAGRPSEAKPGAVPGVVICARCGAVRPADRASDPGIKLLSRLVRVGLGADARVLGRDDQGSE